VAKVLEGEVAMGMDTLRAGQKKAVRFEVVHESPSDIDLVAHDVPTQVEGEALPVPKRKVPKNSSEAKPGHCVGCGEPFSLEGVIFPNPYLFDHLYYDQHANTIDRNPPPSRLCLRTRVPSSLSVARKPGYG
jgi:hypothetical protein